MTRRKRVGRLATVALAAAVMQAWASPVQASCDPRTWDEMLPFEEFRVKCARPALGIDWLHEKYDEALNNFRMWRAKLTPEEEAAKERAFKQKEKWRNLIEEKRRRVEIERLELEIRERDRELEYKRKREEDALRLRRELELDRAAMRRGDEGGINLDVKPTSEAKDLSDVRKKVLELPR